MNNLIIYNKYNDFIYYIYLLIDKIPKSDKIVIGLDVRKYLLKNLELIIEYYNKKNINFLKLFNINMIIINNLIRIIYKRKYISIKNYNAYVRKSSEIIAICKGLIKYENVKDKVL